MDMKHQTIKSCLANISIAQRLLTTRILSKKERREVTELANRALVTLRYLCNEDEHKVQYYLNRM